MTFYPYTLHIWKTEEESNGELAFLDALLKRNNGEIFVLVYRKPTGTDQYLHYSSYQQTSYKENVASSLYNRAYSIITNKDDLQKENARIKQVLMENGYQESIISKIFRRITNNHSLPPSQQPMQATDRYQRGGDQNEYKLTTRWRYQWKTMAYTQISLNKINFLHWKDFA